MRANLMTVSVDGRYLVASSPVSGIELARVRVRSETTADHIVAAMILVRDAFDALAAEGYERAGGREATKGYERAGGREVTTGTST